MTKQEAIELIKHWQGCHVSEFCCSQDETDDANRELAEVIAWIEQNTAVEST